MNFSEITWGHIAGVEEKFNHAGTAQGESVAANRPDQAKRISAAGRIKPVAGPSSEVRSGTNARRDARKQPTIKFPPQNPTLAVLRERETKLQMEIDCANRAICAFHNGLNNLAVDLADVRKQIVLEALLEAAKP